MTQERPAMDEAQLRTILQARTIAVVGASTDPDKDSHQIPALLIRRGYDVIPVHPKATEIFGRTAYPTLADIPVPVDIVDVFRPSAEVPGITEAAVAIGAPVVWVQLGITSPEAAGIAADAGITYLEDICIGATANLLDAHPAPDGA